MHGVYLCEFACGIFCMAYCGFAPVIAFPLIGWYSEGGAIRKMEAAKLLKTAPYIHTMLQHLLDIDVSSLYSLTEVV